jgi:predicted TIM-barrel fold metal-dependent hydrolase
MKLRERGEE